MKRLQATFIGQDTLGYVPGERYDLYIEPLPWWTGSTMRICRRDYTGWCPYRSIVTFLENWTDIHS